MVHSTDRVAEGESVGLQFDAEDIHVMDRSDHSPVAHGDAP
jgi:hypothetical protein